jgi:hypothetical protein
MKKYLYHILILSVLFVLFGLQSCKDEQVNSSDEIIFPANNVSFSKHVEPLFQQRCALAGCHAGSTPAGGLNLEYNSYQTIMNTPGLVIAHDGGNSSLVQHLMGISTPMPPPKSAQLTQNQIDGVKKWIDEGALNN